MVHRQRTEHRLNSACASQEMASHRLGRVHYQFPGLIAKCQFDRFCFILVAQRGRSAVGVDVLQVLGVHFGIAQRVQHAALGAIRIRCGDMVSISAHAITGQFRVNPGSAGLGVFIFFQHQDAGTLR